MHNYIIGLKKRVDIHSFFVAFNLRCFSKDYLPSM